MKTAIHACPLRLQSAASALLLAAAGWCPNPAQAQPADVGVSVQISQPGVYGRVDIGRFPQPQVVFTQPVVVQPVDAQRVYGRPAPAQPVYLWVPPGHRKHWHKHCGAYGACGVPVLFVQDGWYQQHVRPHGGEFEREQGRDGNTGHGKGHDHGHATGQGKGQGKGEPD